MANKREKRTKKILLAVIKGNTSQDIIDVQCCIRFSGRNRNDSK
jgi:hypothetical protein